MKLKTSLTLLASVTAIIAVAVLPAVSAYRGAGNLAFDESHYYERGIFHAHQVEHRPAVQILPRLVYSLGFEGPKPPLPFGWVAVATLVLDEHAPAAFVAFAVAGPMLLLATSVFLGGRREGRLSGFLALGALVAMPGIGSYGNRLLVETLLAGLVTLCALLVESLGVRSTLSRQLALGALVGLALLTKLTALFLVGPLLVGWALREGARLGARAALLRVSTVGVGVFATAGPWYALWVSSAFGFGAFSAAHAAWADAGSVWTRPWRLVSASCGWTCLVALILLAVALRFFPDARVRAKLGEWGWISAAVLIPSAIVVCIPSNFDPRFFVPALGPLAIWLGRALAAMRSAAPARTAWAAALVLSLVALDGAAALARPRDSGGVGPIVAAIRELPLPASPPSLLCNVGSAPQWNVYKIRLAVELSRPRIRHAVVDLSGVVEPDRETLERCDAIFRLDIDEVPLDGPNQYANLGWQRVSQAVDALGWSRCSACEALAGEVARVEVLVGAKSGEASKRGGTNAVPGGGTARP